MKKYKKHIEKVFVLLILLYATMATAQTDHSSPVQFHGSNRTNGEWSDRPGTYSEIPGSFLRNDLNMTLTVYGIPISANLYLSTEQSDLRQSMDHFRIYFDLKSMALEKARTIASNKSKGMADKRLPGMMRFMDNFKVLELGKCRPAYNELTLTGISLSGANIVFNPGPFYVAFAAGKSKRAIVPSDSTRPVFEQKLLFGNIGFGQKQSSHIYFTYLQVVDQKNSLPMLPDSLNTSPKSNILVGTEGKISLFQNKFNLEGGLCVSMLTRDVTSPALDPGDIDIPEWIVNQIDPKISSGADYAYYVKSDLFLGTTRISGGFNWIGPGYVTLGNPNLINDRMSYDARIDQSFAKRQVSTSLFFRHYNDNLLDLKLATSKSTMYGIAAGFTFRNLPYLNFTYTPFFQKNDNDSMKLDNKIQLFNVSLSYSYPIGQVKSFTILSFYLNNSDIAIDTVLNGSKNQTYSLNESLNFRFPLSLSGSVSWTTADYQEDKRNILSLVFSSSYKAFDKWTNSLGARYSNQVNEQKKFGVFWNSRLMAGKFLELNIRLEENLFRDFIHSGKDYNEFIANAMVVFKW